MVFGKTNGNESHNDRAVASAQEEIRRLARDRDPRHPEAAPQLVRAFRLSARLSATVP
jgi:hypothetical protein